LEDEDEGVEKRKGKKDRKTERQKKSQFFGVERK
jgi:hypothetical protein